MQGQLNVPHLSNVAQFGIDLVGKTHLFNDKNVALCIKYSRLCLQLTLLTDSTALSGTCFPHVVPVLSLLEKGVAAGEGPEPWDTSECGVDVVMNHLEAARSIAHHASLYRTNTESKLQGTARCVQCLDLHCYMFY